MGLVFVRNHLSGGMASLRRDDHLQIFGATVTSMGGRRGCELLMAQSRALAQFISSTLRNLPVRTSFDTCALKMYSGKLVQHEVPSLVLGIAPPALGTNPLGFECRRLGVDI